VIWDTFGAGYWLKPDDYRMIERYIWDSYEPVESIGGFAILRKKESGAAPSCTGFADRASRRRGPPGS
jgi:hypothetical protein